MVSVLCLACYGCGDNITGSDATVDASDELVDVSSVDVREELPTFTVVDGGGDASYCHREGGPQDEYQSCCSGAFCKGFCVLGDDGGATCSCFGIPGGCNGLIAPSGFRVVCGGGDAGGVWRGGCSAENCPDTLCGVACCDSDQVCDLDGGDGGACVNF